MRSRWIQLIARCACGAGFYMGDEDKFRSHITTDSSSAHYFVWTADWIDTITLQPITETSDEQDSSIH